MTPEQRAGAVAAMQSAVMGVDGWRVESSADGPLNIDVAEDIATAALDAALAALEASGLAGVPLEPTPFPGSAQHAYCPHPKWPWFCGDCGYPEYERLKHPPPTAARPR